MGINSVFDNLILIFLINIVTFVCVFCDSYFMYARPEKDLPADLARNTTRLLDRLLDGYDKRLRPGFGGEMLLLFIIFKP